jgi:uncharacterized protein
VRWTGTTQKTALAVTYSLVGHYANLVLPSALTLDRDTQYPEEVDCQIMTDTSSTTTTHPSTQPFPVTTAAGVSPVVNGSLSDTNALDEEDYTIKCICGYIDDDGNTVFCENCQTWQHIECYYPEKAVPEIHLCEDCQPRPLDRKRAIERQKRLREQSDGGDRKTKRPPSKSSHKKKIKPPSTTPEQTNGWHKHERHDSSAAVKDQPPAKRPKTGHQTSGSVASLNGTPKIPDSRKRAFSNGQSYPSPTKSPQDHSHTGSIPTYTLDFLELYERDPGKDSVSADAENFHTISLTTRLSAWQREPVLLAEEIGRPDVDAFIPLDQPLDASAFPKVSLEYKTNTDVEYDGKHPRWQLLRLRTDVRKSQIVGEIKGQIGDLTEYCQGASNRWQELRHPEPFVFFHPSMPIYIDSRREGTQFRYLRRSCHPNVTLKTYTTREGQCHYCFVALHDLSAGTELTAQWYMDRLDQEGKSDNIEWSYWASRLLANFGDCACDKTEPCRLAGLDRRRAPKTLEINTKSQTRTKKAKNKQAISPLSTGQATNSRAGSENNRIQDDDDLADSRSVSGSSRSKSQSRDQTPTNLGILDANPVLGSDLTAREKRKIAMAEKTFEMIEQGQNVQKKKKRTSGGSALNTPGLGPAHQLGHTSSSMPNPQGAGGRPSPSYADVGTSNRYSSSSPPLKPTTAHRRLNVSPRKISAPNTPSPLSSFPRPTYIDHSVQTEPDETEQADSPPPKMRKFSTPNQRLLKRVLEDRARFDQQRSESNTNQPEISPTPQLPSPATSKSSEDVEMKDVFGPNSSPRCSPTFGRRSSDSSSVTKTMAVGVPPPPLPSQAAHSYAHLHPPNGQRLQLSTLPPVPSFSGTAAPAMPASTASPAVNLPSVTPSPFGFAAGSNSYHGLSTGTVTPSPVKKKLSLGDYMSRRINLATTPTIEKTQSQTLESISATAPSQIQPLKISPVAEETLAPPSVTLKPSESFKEEALATGTTETSAIADTVMKEEPIAETSTRTVSAPQFIPVTNNKSIPPSRPLATPPIVISPEVANVLSTLNAMMPVSESRRSHSSSS